MHDAQFHLHHFPKQEDLAALLLDKLREEGVGSPFHKSTVLVRNQGMATWLRQRIAKQTGIAMLVDFPQPNSFMQGLIDEKSVQLDELKWPIYEILPSLLDKPEFKILNEYLSTSATSSEQSLKRYQLSSQIAALYDKYLLYRPEWISAWNAGESAHTGSAHEAWQRALWVELNETNIQHWSQKLLASDSLAFDTELPSALHVFGISNFAPIYVRFLYLLSFQIPVHIYWMNPVSVNEGYWEDAASKRQWVMAEAFDDSSILTDGNPLLASFGRMGREFIHTLYGGDTGHTNIENHQPAITEHPPATNSLERLQHSIYNRCPMESEEDIDSSLTVRSCHTTLRELETLRDYLLRLGEEQPLDTGDVIVLCPDIAAYAPSIEAVFGSLQRDKGVYLPYRISDRSAPINEPSIAAIAQLFSLDKLRFSNREALDLLSIPAIAEHLNLDEQDLNIIRDWVTKSGIRWGFDFNHIQEIAPDCKDSTWTWRAGLDRLLLGYAMPSKELTLWRNLLPFHDIEGSSTRLLGALCDFVQWCTDIRKTLAEPLTLAEWVLATRDWLDKGFSKSPEAQQSIQPLLEIIEKLNEQAPLLTEAVPSNVFAEHLQDYLNDSSPAFGFLNGSVTFCETKPMRAIPARVICLLGMNHDTFPRTSSDAQFDLIKDNRKPGDRSTRDDDCYFFLEAILSARENLYFSYLGTSIKDGKERPPSTALQTLIDSTPGLKKTIVEEKLHVFDPHYFTPPAQSYDAQLLDASTTFAKGDDGIHGVANCSVKLETEPTHIDLEDFVMGLTKSTNYFLRHSLKARRRYTEKPMEEDESINIDGLTGWALKDQLLQSRHFDSATESAWRQQGHIPSGDFGQLMLSKQIGSVEELLEDLPELSHKPIEVKLKGIVISGNIPTDTDGNPLIISASKSPKGRDLLRLWIYQNLSCIASEDETSGCIINLNKELLEKHLASPENPRKNLQFLLQLYLNNLQEAQPNFPETSYAMATMKYKKDESEDAYMERQKTFGITEWYKSTDFVTGEGLDEDIATFFDSDALKHPTFNAIFERVWLQLVDSIIEPAKN